jgi:hypothetical protein
MGNSIWYWLNQTASMLWTTGQTLLCRFLCVSQNTPYTGTGLWEIEIAQQCSNTQVLGTDLNAIQPEVRALHIT